jgi:KaiC/GvpD/RAD55 family RecA-like ATPase
MPSRLSTGIPGLDELMGGGLLPGTLTVLAGATGIGKTQFGVQFSQAGLEQEGRRGIIFDMACRGDAQSHADYAERMFQWQLEKADPTRAPAIEDFFHPTRAQPDYLHVFDYHGRRVTRRDLGFEAWQDWQVELAKKLEVTIAFFYGNFVRGVRRAVVDGVEPAERVAESIQFDLFEYVYHQILRKEAEWVARDLFRQHYRANAPQIEAAAYDPSQVACLLLYTTPETMLDELIVRKLDEGDLLSNANTLIYLGRVRSGNKLGRAMYIAKHRGSACTDEIVPYTIDDHGVRVG